MHKYDVSICVLTYHPDPREEMTTILSALKQEGVSFEIIIADDGSEKNLFPEAEALFRRHGFGDYQLIAHEKNQGTVRNCLDAVRKARGEYTKLISPGDYLYGRQVLKEITAYMRAKKSRACFSDLIHYPKSDPHRAKTEAAMPRATAPYHRENLKEQQLYYLVLGDKACGAAWMTETETLKAYLELIAGKVIYSEDSVYRLMVADGIPLTHQAITSEFYQAGEGISTNGNTAWREKLYRDDTAANEILIGRLEAGKGNRRLIRFLQTEKEHNRKKTNLMKGLLFPSSTTKWIRLARHPETTKAAEDYGFIDECLRESAESPAAE